MISKHKPVLLHEVIDALNLKPGMNVIDCTVGGGGHAEAILARTGPAGRLLGIDADEEALIRTRKRLERFGERALLARGTFRDLRSLKKEHFPCPVHAILFDLGISTDQLTDPGRGFSFLADGPLDMRLGGKRDASTVSARELVNTCPEAEFARIIRKYGEERYARAIAHSLAVSRKGHPIETTLDLAARIQAAVPPHARRAGRIHPATRTFQALRIVVNNELESLEEALPHAVSLLEQGGRCAVISFHSLEDRIVKHSFLKAARMGKGMTVTKKPVTPSPVEVQENPASRSAKLRVFESLGKEAKKIDTSDTLD